MSMVLERFVAFSHEDILIPKVEGEGRLDRNSMAADVDLSWDNLKKK
jgi:hypothetical protein